ncbi:MAG TPA: MFS transporter, partial [Gemmatimonadales bacterium]|nr:MFS transporter [Gemmatimonadales bacterium]
FALFDPVKRDLHLTDAQLGWLASAYVLVFALAALPFGLLGDLRSRRGVIAAGVVLWSACTLAGGFATDFGELLLSRALVGAGGAAFGAAAQSLAADYFPSRGRAVAMGILATGITLGGVVGIWLGGRLEAAYGWRMALVSVSIPGFVLAGPAARLIDPVRPPRIISIATAWHELGMGLTTLVREFLPLLSGLAAGGVLAFQLDRVYGADSKVDVAVFGAAVAIGLALNIRTWVRHLARAPSAGPSALARAFGELAASLTLVLRTRTLVYVFLGGAFVSFGVNGLVGWAPTFMARELGLSVAKAATLLGTWGLVAGICGTVCGGLVADGLRRYTRTGRVLTVSLGLLIGGPLALWLLTVRDLSLFVPVFCAAFFFISWYSGPIAAVIFDVVPARISATVAGAYLLFIHLVGDTVAFPLVGGLSDRFGLDRAVLVLPSVAIAGGLVILAATRTVGRDMERAAGESGI